ncbi:MAG TPA: hypothetical protein VNW29_07170 [Candidatus Sulfotelmatobacter sp.]|jgi:hypothetical protein|nr:hypothetical protein [Candidatus Sulfotelmatobacter sp.]
MDIFQSFGHLFSALGIIFTSIIGHSHAIVTSLSPQPTIAVSPISTDASSYNLNRSFSYQEYSLMISAAVPKNGGNIIGKISGDCNGTINGHYDGKENGTLNGQANVTCKVSFVQIPGIVTFNGTISKTAKNAQLLITLAVSSFKKSQNITVNF